MTTKGDVVRVVDAIIGWPYGGCTARNGGIPPLETLEGFPWAENSQKGFPSRRDAFAMAVLRRKRLTEPEVGRQLKRLKGWKVDGVFLVKKYKFATFLEAVAFMNRVFAAAEAQDHHPDLSNVWAFVTIKWSTHDVGGLTDWDFAMAARCDALA